jgi:hypothetical protein
MEFIETPIFTEAITKFISDDSYLELQKHLADNPEVGSLIQGTGGLRKIRWSAKGHGKRGGIRIIYYYYVINSVVYMFLAYPKNEKDNLTPKEKKYLKLLLEDYKNG